jgi:hypothetical protein
MLRVLALVATLVAFLGAPLDVAAFDLAAVTSESSDASLDRARGAVPAPYSVVQGIIASSDRNGIELVLTNGTRLTVPLSVRSVLHTQLTPNRPIKASCTNEGEEKVVDTIFVVGIHPGNGG